MNVWSWLMHILGRRRYRWTPPAPLPPKQRGGYVGIVPDYRDPVPDPEHIRCYGDPLELVRWDIEQREARLK